MRIRNFTKMGEGLQCCRSSPGGRSAMKGGRSDMLQIYPHGGKVCNVADLSGGRSAMLQTFRGKVCKGEGLQYNACIFSERDGNCLRFSRHYRYTYEAPVQNPRVSWQLFFNLKMSCLKNYKCVTYNFLKKEKLKRQCLYIFLVKSPKN